MFLRGVVALCTFGASCGFNTARFVDVPRPAKEVSSEIREKAKEHNPKAKSEHQHKVEQALEEDGRKQDAAALLAADLISLWDKKIELLTYRVGLAHALAELYTEAYKPCDKVLDFSVSPMDCERLKYVGPRARGIETKLDRELTNATATRDALARELDENDTRPQEIVSPDAAPSEPTQPEPMQPEPMQPEPTQPTPPQNYAGLGTTLDADGAEQLLAASDEETLLDKTIEEVTKQRYAALAQQTLDYYTIEASTWGFHIRRIKTTIAKGEAKDVVTSGQRYNIYQLSAATRIVAKEEWEAEAMNLLLLPDTMRECLTKDRKKAKILSFCPSDAPPTMLRSGMLDAIDSPRATAYPKSLRSVFFGGSDPNIGGHVGVGLGFRAGFQSGTKRTGQNTFRRTKFALLLGMQVDLNLDIERANDRQPYTFLAVKPELGFRIALAQVFQLTPHESYETGAATSLDLTAGATFDTLNRKGLTFSASVFPFNPAIGGYVRWDRFSGGRNNIVGGIEFADEGVTLPATAAAAAAGVGLIIFLFKGIYECDQDPECRH